MGQCYFDVTRAIMESLASLQAQPKLTMSVDESFLLMTFHLITKDISDDVLQSL